jgi:hypothetical protein
MSIRSASSYRGCISCYFENTHFWIVRFQVLTVASVKTPVFWYVAPCSLKECDPLFGGACCLSDDGGSTLLWNVGQILRDITDDSHVRFCLLTLWCCVTTALRSSNLFPERTRFSCFENVFFLVTLIMWGRLTNGLTGWLAQWFTVFLEKFVSTQLIKNFHVFHGS